MLCNTNLTCSTMSHARGEQTHVLFTLSTAKYLGHEVFNDQNSSPRFPCKARFSVEHPELLEPSRVIQIPKPGGLTWDLLSPCLSCNLPETFCKAGSSSLDTTAGRPGFFFIQQTSPTVGAVLSGDFPGLSLEAVFACPAFMPHQHLGAA